jgi:hypothetical protein
VRAEHPFCGVHRRGTVAVRADASKEIQNAKVLASNTGGLERERAIRSMQRIARHRIYRLWRLDPRSPEIDLLELCAADEQRMAHWLKQNHGVDINAPLPATGRQPTARCRDRLRYAAWRVLRRGASASPQFIEAARRRVTLALRDDEKFWRKWDAFDEDNS